MSGVSASGFDGAWSLAATSDIILVDVTPAPGLAGLEGLDDRVPDRMGMRPGVPHGFTGAYEPDRVPLRGLRLRSQVTTPATIKTIP